MQPDKNDFRPLNSTSHIEPNSAEPIGSASDHSTATNDILTRMVKAIEQPGSGNTNDEVPWKSLLDVVRQHRSSQFSVNPVVTDLVRAVLGKSPALNESAAEHMVEFVAETLFANCDSRTRLHRMWDHLNLVLENERS